MSRFLKFIVNLFLIAAILTAAVILVPPILGVGTTIVDTASMDTNLPLGSVTYSQDVNAADLKAGDTILKESEASTYAYVLLADGDLATGKYRARSVADAAGEEEITIRNTVSKVYFTIPYIGFIVMAMHSLEGLIVIGLVILFMIILFILSELWRVRDDDDEDEDDEDEDEENENRMAAQAADVDRQVREAEQAAREISTASAAALPPEMLAEVAAISAAAAEKESASEAPASGDVPDVTGDSVETSLEKMLTSDAAAASGEGAETPASEPAPAANPVPTANPVPAVTSDGAEASASGAATEAEASGTPGEDITEAPAAEEVPAEAAEEEDPYSFVPVKREELESVLAKAGTGVPVKRDDTTGVTVVDLSGRL